MARKKGENSCENNDDEDDDSALFYKQKRWKTNNKTNQINVFECIVFNICTENSEFSLKRSSVKHAKMTS